MLNKLEIYKNFLDTKRPLEKNIIKKIENDLKTNFIYNTNGIEGNTLTLRETGVILEYGVTVKGKPLKEHLEVKGQEYALDFLAQEVKENSTLSVKLIKDFHNIILRMTDPEIAGVFKRYNNSISNSQTKTSSPFHTEEALIKLIENYNKSEENIIEKVAKFHADFEQIHPFVDGNGRTGRLIMNLELMKAGYPICIISKEDRLEYYDSLELAQTEKNYSKIINFIENSLEKTFEIYFNHISNDWKKELENFKNKK